VSGVAALVRSKFPDLRADEVVRRITSTAHGAARSPSNLVGAGGVDPVAALTWEVPEARNADAATVRSVAAPPPPAPDDPTPRTVAFVGTGVLALAVLATAAVSAHRRKDKAS
jgi:membrane-anchored mycosin MYCP